MKLIPIYYWNKTRKIFHEKGHNLTQKPWFQGVLLIICVAIALLLANLPLTRDLYQDLLNTELIIKLKSPDGAVNVSFPQNMNVGKFINDILMVVGHTPHHSRIRWSGVPRHHIHNS